ncbi:hypothetical protein BBJ28_00024472 [Nothophytophthora sp. Chile5]|nr:hypothetical protein BBJ28_00024472 [Nothophytophthora sp. Chile5]
MPTAGTGVWILEIFKYKVSCAHFSSSKLPTTAATHNQPTPMVTAAVFPATTSYEHHLPCLDLRQQPPIPVVVDNPQTPVPRTHAVAVDDVQQRLGLKLEAHRRWNAAPPLGFLCSVDYVEIHETRPDNCSGVVYVLEVYLSLPTSRLPTSRSDPIEESAASRHHRQLGVARPTYKLERRFADFEELRGNVMACVSLEQQCSCKYCLSFLEYIRFSWTQPRGLVKLISGTEKRRQMLTTFINDFVSMGQRRATKPGKSKRKCEAQTRIPEVLTAFLLEDAIF